MGRTGNIRSEPMTTKILPYILIAIQACAGIVCFAQRDVRHGVYWIAAAVLNAAVTV